MSELHQEQQVTKTVVTGYKCDVCSKLSNGLNREGWHDFSSQHFEWGNDSVDSYAKHDVCSADCYIKRVGELLDEWGDRPTLVIGDLDLQFATRLIALTKTEAAS